ncbi:MAG: prepilin-type N-terminal cleavage/methylation domain-containing protein [Deltaproteobacteria bacterium]|nr:prepilin-type N-terminal cleavage/methylation domain-containing protein [Deltaproteobacteria bacterium]
MRDSKQRHSSPSRREAGFSLIEVMIAVVVMSVGMVGLVSMLNVAAKRDGDGRRKDRATAIAYDLLHYLERLPFDAPALVDTHTSNGTDLMDENGTFAGMDNTNLPASTFDHSGGDLPDADTGSFMGVVVPADQQFVGYAPAGTFTEGTGNRPTLDFNNDGKDDFNRNWIVVDDPPRPGESVSPGKKIGVVVTWRDPSLGIRQRVTVVGYRANRKLVLPQQ